jgi:hypothetical protein
MGDHVPDFILRSFVIDNQTDDDADDAGQNEAAEQGSTNAEA